VRRLPTQRASPRDGNFPWRVDAPLIDMNLTIRWVQHLLDAGHEAVHWSTIGKPTAPDSEICLFARERGYIILTNDLDFPQILAHTRELGPSVVLLRGEPLVPETRCAALLQALENCGAELARGAVVSLDWSAEPRARVLPFR
jgi:predicted nuclease of predicted toxin-antitoxin system